jgi:hypothetical protein
LSDVLNEIGTPSMRLIYSSEVVPARMRVEVEPTEAGGQALLRELLEPHGLRAEHVGGIVYAVVRVPSEPGPARSPAATPARPEPIEEVVVVSSRYRLADDARLERTFLTQAELEALPRLADDSLKAVHRLPGAATNGLSGLAYMRGGEQSETLVVFDGLPMYEPFHLRLLSSPASILDPRTLDSLEVYAGGFTTEFGDRISAVIDASSTRPDAERYYEAGLSVFYANALASARFADGRGQWLASARRSNLDLIADMVESDVGKPSYADGFARIDYRFDDATSASLHMLLATDRSSLRDSEETERANADYRNGYFWATLDRAWTPALNSTLLLSYSDVAAHRKGTVEEPGRRTGFVDDDRDYHVFGAKLDGSWTGARWFHRAGLEFRSLSARYRYRSEVTFEPDYPFPGDPGGTTARDLLPTPDGNHVAAYASSRLRVTDRLTAEAGVRWDEQTYGARSDEQFVPRLNLAFDAGATTRLRASWGKYQQAQSINELQVEDGVTEFQPTQRADMIVLGLDQGLSGNQTLRIEAYRKDYTVLRPRYENLLDPLSLLPELRWDRVRIAPSSARATGVEILLSRKLASPWNGWINYAWSQVEDREDGVDTRRGWDQKHSLGGGISWTSDPWTATLAATWHSGWPTTSVRLAEPVSTPPEVLIGDRNDVRLKDFLSVDARVSRTFRLRRGELDAWFEITNLTNRANPCCIDYRVLDGAPPVLLRDEDHWLPIVPAFGVLWRY